MKKFFAMILMMCLASMTASAQWKVESMESGEPNTKLLQVLETEKSVLVYATFQKNCDDLHTVFVNRNAYAKAGGLKYKILNSVNLPLQDDAENRSAYLQEGNNEINFVMEFEKFPVENGFDIIEGDKEGDFCFNYHGITVSRIDSTQRIDTERFLDNGTPVIYGRNVRGGTSYSYVIRNGVCITCNAVRQEGSWFEPDDMIFYLDIVNNSDHGIMFDFDAVSVVGKTKKKNGTVDEKVWTKYTPDSYERHFARLDYDEARYQTSGVLNEVGRKLENERFHSPVNSWERIGWAALGMLNEHAIQNRVSEYLKEHPKNRPSALRSESLKAGDSIHGYIATKKKKGKQMLLTIPIDGFDFKFLYNVR